MSELPKQKKFQKIRVKKMNNEPVAWGMLDKDGGIYDSISPEEHDREEGAYTIPLYTHPAKTPTDEEILREAYYILMREQQRKAQEK
jgi:hypothetical protein